MKTTEKIFNITPENLTELILEYYSSINHDGSLLDDLKRYDKYCVSDINKLSEYPFISELIDNDKYGERIGSEFRNSIDSDKMGYRCSAKHIYLYFDKDMKLRGYMECSYPDKLDRMYDVEVFEYNDDIRYSKRARCITCGEENHGFTYYRYMNGNVAEILRFIRNFGGYGNASPFDLALPLDLKVHHIVFDGSSSCTILKDDLYYLKLIVQKNRYKIREQYDLLNPAPAKEVPKRVIDTQKRLTKKLDKRILPDTTLEQAVDIFFDVVSEAKYNEEEMLLYEVGRYEEHDTLFPYYFSLVRQTPTKHDEYYHMQLKITYELGEKNENLRECEWHEIGDDDLREYVLNSYAYKELKDEPIKKIEVTLDET
ncbi:MAG: hypothetical protein IJT37_00075 [Lachnospiraceae bacterium]|nr:hypothetical protein [Lachnospiraceae bacterium]